MDSALVDRASQQFLDQWKRLVSTTNWDKGRIICEWREALRISGAPASEFSDEAWSRRVGNVTPQHVGRLRRAFERFGASRDDYAGLYWSHFQAALDWDDAEMWLEGAVQSGWSIAEMRHQRWQALGAVGTVEPAESDLATLEAWDEDAEPDDASGEVVSGKMEVVSTPGRVDDECEQDYDRSEFDDEGQAVADSDDRGSSAREVRPFAELPPLPPDVNEAFEAYKLCILRHRVAGWLEISRDDMVASLAALRMLALAPAEVYEPGDKPNCGRGL